jgi:hypothetical protein
VRRVGKMMYECVNVLVGNAVDGKGGPGLEVANIVDQNGYKAFHKRRGEGAPVVDTLAGARTYGDDVHTSVCKMELRLDLCEFLSIPAVRPKPSAASLQWSPVRS